MTEKTVPDRTSAAHWYASLPEPALRSELGGQSRLNLRRYVATPPLMEQPALQENLVCLHLGGSKRIERRHEGRTSVYDVAAGSLTILPASQANRWLTHGPVDFGLIALSPELFRQAAIEEFDREPAACALHDAVGFRSPGIERLFQALLASVGRPGAASRLYPESLLVVLTVALLRDYSTFSHPRSTAAVRMRQGGLADRRLRRVVDHMMDNLHADVGLAELTALTGLSRAQFFRAFKQSTGSTPGRYLATLRLDKARALLDDTNLQVDEVAEAVGLGAEARLTELFKQRFGVTPKRYRVTAR